ncbi:unnamed protein product [Amoebophrya sp. A120]|nr:unnamed protein product [Amoebophrya sp. A120]|eukprot:GSA120T00016348001.1
MQICLHKSALSCYTGKDADCSAGWLGEALHLQHDRRQLRAGNSITNCLQTRPRLRLLAF